MNIKITRQDCEQPATAPVVTLVVLSSRDGITFRAFYHLARLVYNLHTKDAHQHMTFNSLLNDAGILRCLLRFGFWAKTLQGQ